MENKTCTVCNIEKHINNFYKNYPEHNNCNVSRGIKRYYDNKDKISIQQKTSFEKNRDKLLQKQNDYTNKRNIDYKKLLNRLKAVEENLSINDSEKH